MREATAVRQTPRQDPASAEGRAALALLLARATGAEVSVGAVRPLSGGAASSTWAVAATVGGTLQHYILQRTEADDDEGLPRAVQAEVQRRAGLLGVPVPPLVAIAGPADGLGEAVLTGLVAGEALAPRWLKGEAYAAARGALAGQCAAALARLHAAPRGHWDGLPLGGGSGAALLAELERLYRRLAVDVPAFDLAFAALRPRMPDTPASCLVHGDFRSGNFLVDEHGLAAVLDWELAHWSVPEEDLGWLCVQAWRFGRWQQAAGGFASRAELLDGYRRAGGWADADALFTWELYGNLRWGIFCLRLADDHLSGRVPSVERAAIGRRVSEVSADIVHMLACADV